ncbi:MAG: MarC family protein [Crocinitomicaceae bacterium]
MKKREKDDAFNRSEITLTPLALPMLAGPGSMSLLITYNQEQAEVVDKIPVLLAIGLVAATIFFILISSRVINRHLGASGITALSRIVGFIVISIGVEFIVSAITNIVIELK